MGLFPLIYSILMVYFFEVHTVHHYTYAELTSTFKHDLLLFQTDLQTIVLFHIYEIQNS